MDAFLDRGREPDAVDDASVIEFIADDDVARLAKRGKHCFIRGPCAHERIARLRAHVASDRAFEFPVRAESAADETNARSPRAVIAQCFGASFDYFRMVREAQVIV